jgi:hypothetical protein
MLTDEPVAGERLWARLLPLLTAGMLIHGVAMLWLDGHPDSGDSTLEIVRSTVMFVWCGLPYCLLLAAQLFFSRTLGAKFALLATTLVTSGVGVILYNRPPTTGHTVDLGVLGAFLSMMFTGAHMSLAVMGAWIAQSLSRQNGRPDKNEMKLTRPA